MAAKTTSNNNTNTTSNNTSNNNSTNTSNNKSTTSGNTTDNTSKTNTTAADNKNSTATNNNTADKNAANKDAATDKAANSKATANDKAAAGQATAEKAEAEAQAKKPGTPKGQPDMVSEEEMNKYHLGNPKVKLLTKQEIEADFEEAKKEESPEYIHKCIKEVNSAKTAYEYFRHNGKLKDLVVGLKQYQDFIAGPKRNNPNEYVSQSYRFYNNLIKHFNTTNYPEFKLRMDILLKTLNGEKDKHLNVINLLKYDIYWKYGQKTKVSYYLLMTFLDAVADPNTRKEQLKTIDMNKLAGYVPEQVMLNFRRYFNV